MISTRVITHVSAPITFGLLLAQSGGISTAFRVYWRDIEIEDQSKLWFSAYFAKFVKSDFVDCLHRNLSYGLRKM